MLRYLFLLIIPTALSAQDTIPFVHLPQIAAWREAAAQTDTVYIVNFWATWCEPCVAELPSFERLNQAYSNQPVRVVLLSMDLKKQVKTKLIPFVQRNQLKSQVLFMDERTPNKWINAVTPEWSGAIPATWIVGRKGERFHEGKLSYEELEGILKEIL